jgi:9-cis-beta-carotene 9',10'-cleaving dioxygenase
MQVCIQLDADGKSQKCSVEAMNEWRRSSDFPVINPAFSGSKNTYIYAATSSGSRPTLPHFPFDSVVKLNLLNNSVRTWSVGSRRFIGEPIFVAKGDEEDDGYLLVVEVSNAFIIIYILPNSTEM